MMTMSVVSYILSKQFLRHFLAALGLTAIILAVVILSLKGYTRHGDEYPMPELVGLDVAALEAVAVESGLEVVVTDSVYSDEQPGGTVLNQDPLPGAMVKKGRKVYITTVALSVEKVPLPELTDYTVRQALAMLETYGLGVDSLVFVPDVGKTVMEVRLGEEEAEAGMMLPRGTKLILVVGRGNSNERQGVPFLVGKSREEALKLLARSYLNVGAEFFPEGSDSTGLVVVRQKPAYLKRARIPLGVPFDLWYEDSHQFDLEEAMRQLGIDSLEADSLLRGDTVVEQTFDPEF